MGFGIIPAEPDGLAEAGDCIAQPALLHEHGTKVVVQFGPAGLQTQGSVEAVDRLVVAAQGMANAPEAGPNSASLGWCRRAWR